MAVGDVDGVKAALARGADTNARDGKGWTALMHTADKGYALIVPALLGAGADPNLRLADGATALFIAAVHGHTEIIGFLMEAGAKVSDIPAGRPLILSRQVVETVYSARVDWRRGNTRRDGRRNRSGRQDNGRNRLG